IRSSFAKEVLALKYYLKDDIGRFIIIIILIIISTVFVRSVKRKLIDERRLHHQHHEQLVVRYPALSATLIVVGLFQFLFAEPPFIFNCFVWIMLCICLAIIFRGFISKYWFRFWIIIVLLFAAACADNLILQASRTERWMMIGISSAGVIYGTY